MSLQIEEQETHINFMRGDERAKIYTSDTTMMTKFNKLVELAGKDWRVEEIAKLPRTGEIIGITYSCPVSFVSYRKKDRNISEEQRQQARAQMENINAAKINREEEIHGK